jgi:hypothetical protein
MESKICDVAEDSLINFEQAKRSIEKGLGPNEMIPEIWRVTHFRAWLSTLN